MLRRYAWLWRSLFILVDLSVSAGVFLGAYALRFHSPIEAWFPRYPERPSFDAYARALPAMYVILFVTNSYFHLYQPRRVSSFLDELVDILKSNALAIVLFMAFFFTNRNYSYSRSLVAMFAVMNPAAVFLFRVCVRTGLRWLRTRGHNLRHILIAGTGRPAQALIHKIRANPWTGLRVQGIASLTRERVGSSIHGVPVVGTVSEIGRLLDELGSHQVFIALPFRERAVIERLLLELAQRFVPVRLVPDIGSLLTNQVTTEFDGIRILNLWENHLSGWNAFWKRSLDVVVAATALTVLSPLLLLIAASVKLATGGPVFYIQKRMGHDGRVFPMLKFCTMRAGTEDDTHFTRPDDARSTPIGRFLRKTSLDELPQLLNVLLGQMSLVGPRPERPVFIDRFRRTLPRYMLRHRAKAGMTGWAQVNGWRGDTSLKKRLQYDLYYLHNWSLAFDIKILLLTLFRGWRHRNAY
jgi:Undecaprenyl-phosphate glucose phosphotransferase